MREKGERVHEREKRGREESDLNYELFDGRTQLNFATDTFLGMFEYKYGRTCLISWY